MTPDTFEDRYLLSVDVNDGKKRIVFGSTETMGAGVNFQRLLKSIMHVDAPWRPRDIEQQNGRGYRQGNTTGTLDVYNMVTKGSLDTGLWNVLETKAIAIRQVMDGSDKGTREIEENYYGSVKELSIDNPLMKEAIELDHAIKKLKSLQKGFRNEVASAARQLSLLPSETKRLGEETEKIRKDISLRAPEAKGEDFVMVISGREYRERREAGLELIKAAKLLNEKARTSQKEVEKMIGSYSGYPLLIRANGLWDNQFAEICVKGQYYAYGADVRVDSDPVGVIRSFHHSVYKGMDSKLDYHEKMLKSREATRPGLEKMASGEFGKTAELEEKETRYKMLVEALQAHNELNRDSSNECQIDWEGLEAWPADKVKEEIERYLNSIATVMVARKDVEVPSIVEKVLEETKKLYGLELPPMLQLNIDKAINEDCLGAKKAMDIIVGAIGDFDSKGPTWIEGNGDGLAGSYARNKGIVRAGDVLIRKTMEGEKYGAYLVTSGGLEKYLGGEGNLSSLRERVRRFYVFNSIALRLRKEVDLSKMREPLASYGKSRVEQELGR
jgi:hypothetical protein